MNHHKEKEIKRIISFFVESLNGRFKEYVSDVFLKYLLFNLTINQFNNYSKNGVLKTEFENVTYRAGVEVFEYTLEHGCKIRMNGHHVAQNFSTALKEINFKEIPKEG